ncbi:MAG: acyl--CoA ligase, partial [Acidimicrobiales bacterium]|nr:acyl--CoA ligase [Acidimicrobiales bacterium]
MPISFEEACDQVMAEGTMFNLVDAEIRGRTYKVFEAAPPNLLGIYELTAARGDETFLVYEDEQWSFGDTIAQGKAIGAALAADHGVQPGDRVAIAMRNYPEWITALIGIHYAGAIGVMLNAWWTGEELAYGITDSGAKVVFADTERADRIRPQSDLGVAVIVARHTELPDGAIDIASLSSFEGDPPAVEIAADDDATIMYTSGTTGFPKGAVATHRAIISAILGYAARGAVAAVMGRSAAAESGETKESKPPVFILTVPLFHITGLVPVMYGALAGGLKLVMMYKWEPKRALELIEREKVSTFVGVPTMVQDLIQCPEFDQFDTSSLSAVGGGGAPAAPDLVKKVDKTVSNASPGIGYGMTETTAYGPQNAGPDYLERPTSTGRAVPVLQIKVIDASGNDLGPNEQGEICFYGPNVIRAYWNKPEATEEAFIDGWLRSGDIGRIDEEGFVYVEDRAKDVVIRAGENIGCIEVEAAIAEHPAVYECAVFGVPHERLGEELACAV